MLYPVKMYIVKDCDDKKVLIPLHVPNDHVKIK